MKRLGFWLAILLTSTTTMAVCAGENGFADNGYGQPQSAPLFRSYFESSGRIGNDLSMFQGDLFLTTLQTDRSLLFLDARTNYVDADKYEGNFGMGWRGIIDDCYIFGMYAYYDRSRSASENYFSQGTAGIEFMSVEWDFRVNGYFPQTAGERLGQSVALFNGNTFIIETPMEYAYYGTDLEVGKLLVTSTDGKLEMRGFATAYYFDRDVPGYEEIAGGRARLEMRMYDVDWLGEGSRVMLGAQYQYDDYRESVASGLLSVRIPFGSASRSPDRLQRRIVDSIVRDNDIVTRRGNLREIGLDPTTGNPFIATTVLDGASDAVAQVAAAQSNSMIVANGDLGIINVSAPLVLKSGQILRPGGFDVIGKQTGTRARFGSVGSIVGTNPLQNVIELADNVEVFDMTVSGGLNTVFGDGVTDINIHDNQFLGAAQTGFATLGTSRGEIMNNVIQQGVSFDEFRGTFTQNNVTANPNFAINIGSLNGSVTNNTFAGNSAAGATVTTMTSGSFDDNVFSGTLGDGATFNAFNSGSFSNNTFANVTNRGIAISSMAGGTVDANDIQGTPTTGVAIGTFTGGTISNHFVSNATQDGISIGTLSGGVLDGNSSRLNGRHGFFIGSFTAGDLTNNTGSSNTGNGFQIDVLNTSIVDGQFSGNSASNNTIGFSIGSVLGSPSISQNSATNNTSDGFQIASLTSELRMDNNVSSNNAGHGYNLPVIGSGFLTANTGNNNGGTGMLLAGIGTAFVTDGTFNGNGASGMILGDMTVGSVRNNTALNNIGNGISLGIVTNGTISDNTASNNTGHGFDIVDFDFGTAENNTAETNGGNGFNFAEITNGTLRSSSANNNTADGFFVGTYDGSILGTIETNSADANGGDGFDIGSVGGWSNAGQLNTNSATNNTGFGYNIQGRTGGTAAGNVATGNGDDTLP